MMFIDVIDKRKSPKGIKMGFRWIPAFSTYYRCRRIDWLHWIVDVEPKRLADIAAGALALLVIAGIMVTL